MNLDASSAKIRTAPLAEEHLDGVVAIERECAALLLAKGIGDAQAREERDLVALTKRHNVRIAEAEHAVVGYVAWRDEAPGVAIVEVLAVSPERMRAGIGGALLSLVRREAAALRLEDVVVRVDGRATWAVAFLKKHGFVPLSADAQGRVKLWAEEQGAAGPVAPPGFVVMRSTVRAPA